MFSVITDIILKSKLQGLYFDYYLNGEQRGLQRSRRFFKRIEMGFVDCSRNWWVKGNYDDHSDFD